MVKTLEKFEVQDGKIVEWEIKHLKESVDLIEQVVFGYYRLEAEVKDGKIVVTKVIPRSPAAFEAIRAGGHHPVH